MVWCNIGHLSTLIHEILLFAKFFFKERPSYRRGDKPACGERPNTPRGEGFRSVTKLISCWVWVLGRGIWPGVECVSYPRRFSEGPPRYPPDLGRFWKTANLEAGFLSETALILARLRFYF